MIWTPERVALLQKLLPQKLTASQIAARIGGGLTRNAVIGKVHRMGLAILSGYGCNPKRPTRLGKSRAVPPPRKRLTPAPKMAVPVVRPEKGDPQNYWRPYAGNGVTFMARKAGQCAWPICKTGSDGIEMSCGCPVTVDSPYCSWHQRASAPRSYGRPVISPAIPKPKSNIRIFT